MNCKAMAYLFPNPTQSLFYTKPLFYVVALILLNACALQPSSPNAQAPSLDTPNNSMGQVSSHSPPISTIASSHAEQIHTNESHVIQRVWLTAPPAANTLDLTVSPDNLWERIRHGFSIPNLNTPTVEQWQNFYTSQPDAIKHMVERASLYLYHITEELQRRGMPTELALLPFVESAYNPMALSSARASGMWQFIPSTGQLYKLKQDRWRDERRDVIASTTAALDYLNYLFELYGDWHLALASYNWGEGAVRRAIEKNKAHNLPTDYLSLDMPKETRNYVPKLQAIKNIISNPMQFGVVLPPVDNEPYFSTIEKTQDIDVATAAKLAEMPLEEFKALNPSFKRPLILGAQSANILLPIDKVDVFRHNLEQHQGPLSHWALYTFKRGDRLDRVAKKNNISLAYLKSINNIGRRDRVTPGMVLIVPRRINDNSQASTIAHATKQNSSQAKNAIKTKQHIPRNMTHIVKRGETLYSISAIYKVSVNDLKQWNKLRGTLINIGQKILVKRETTIAEASSNATITK